MSHEKENSALMARLYLQVILLVSLSAGNGIAYGNTTTTEALTVYENAASKAFSSLRTLNFDWCQEPDLDKIEGTIRVTGSPIPKEVVEFKNRETLSHYMIDRYKDGRVKALSELDKYSNLTGTMFSWYSSGEFLGCAELKLEKHHGPSVARYRNGTPKAYAEFYNGEQSGAELRFDEQFNLVRYANYLGGQMHGIAFFWSSSGHLIGVSEYERGKLVNELLSIDKFEEIHFMDHRH